jgi:Family of unknown function (DUF5752)
MDQELELPEISQSGEPAAVEPFAVKDCALITIATGKRAQNLKELRDNLAVIDLDSVYYHFWGNLLVPRFENPEYNNDFADWARHDLHDATLAERLSVISPTVCPDLEVLRQELIDVMEERLDETELRFEARPDRQFAFMRSQIVIFDTRRRVKTPEELARVIPSMTGSSVFFHFIDAHRRTPEGMDDFQAWMVNFGERYADLAAQLAAVDPYFVTLAELRQKLVDIFADYFRGRAL